MATIAELRTRVRGYQQVYDAPMTTDQVAALLDMSVGTVRRRIARGELQAERDPHGWYFIQPEAILALLDSIEPE